MSIGEWCARVRAAVRSAAVMRRLHAARRLMHRVRDRPLDWSLFNDCWPATDGWLELRAVQVSTGRVVGEYCGPNMVVTAGRAEMPAAYAGVVTQVAVGTSATPATPDDLAPLTDQVAVAVTGHDFPDIRSVRWEFTVAGSLLPGVQVREFGLLTSAGVMVARKSFAAGWPMTSDIEIQGKWTLRF